MMCRRCNNTKEYLGTGFMLVKCDCNTLDEAISQVMQADKSLTKEQAKAILTTPQKEPESNVDTQKRRRR